MTARDQVRRNLTVLLCVLALSVLVAATAACITSASPAGIVTAGLAVLIVRELLLALRVSKDPGGAGDA